MSTRTTAVTYDEANLILSALKRWEFSEGETDDSRMLVARFRRMRSELLPPQAADTAAIQSDIFSAGLCPAGGERN